MAVVELKAGAENDRTWTDTQEIEAAEQGARPGSRLLRKVTFGATLNEIDNDAQTVTLLTAHGLMKVSVDPSVDLERFARGAQVSGRMEQDLRLSVTPR